MTKLIWDAVGDRFYSAGVDRGVFYPLGSSGVAWSGLTSVQETDVDVTSTIAYLDGKKTFNQLKLGAYSATIQAFTYPTEFEDYAEADIWSEDRFPRSFNFCYRTKLGSDIDVEHGYQIHLVYNALAEPSSSNFTSLGDTPTPQAFSWRITTKPVPVPNARPTAHVVIDTTFAYPWLIQALEVILYGSNEAAPRFPTIDELLTIFEEMAILRIINHGDGTWTAISRDDYPDVLTYLDPTTFQIDWDSVQFLDNDTYQVSTL